MVNEHTIECEISASGVVEGIVLAQNHIVGEVTCPLYSVAVEHYNGKYDVVPKPNEKQVLETIDKIMDNNITIFEIPYFEVSNHTGNTVYIGKEIKVDD